MEVSDELKKILPLKPQEIELIYLIRNKYRFGSLEIIVQDGVPVDIVQTIRRQRLSTGK